MVACSCKFESRDFSWDSADERSSLEVVERLVGLQLVAVEVDDSLINPIFHFSDGARLRVFADTDVDPWTLSLPGSPWVIVGVSQEITPSD